MRSAQKQLKRLDILYRNQRGRCCYCNRQVRRKDATTEHIIPKCAGGTNRPSNLAMACKQCNVKKSVEDAKFRIFSVEDCLTSRLVFCGGEWFTYFC